MKTLQTVLGRIEASCAGHCQLHEHVFVRPTPAAVKNPVLCIDDEISSARELEDYRAAGGGLILDCQPGGAGRDLAALRRMSRKSGVHIVGVTGYHMPMFYPGNHSIFSDSLPRLRERFLTELLEGVDAAGETVYPGAVKAAIGKDGAEGRFEICLRAAAGAAAQACVPLILHTECGTGAVRAVSICEGEGLDPSHIAVCHADRQAHDFAPHEALARTGVYLEYDTIGRFKYHDDESECALIRHMLEKGHEDRLLLSLDTTAARLGRYGGEISLCYILMDFMPRLEGCGVGRSTILKLTHENPIELFNY